MIRLARKQEGRATMTRPWTYRPTDPEQPDWEDNALSNAMAWASDTFVGNWCKQDDHWTFAVTKPIWTECSCCLTFRGVILGLIVGFVIGAVVL